MRVKVRRHDGGQQMEKSAELSLTDAVHFLLEESRMVLPGIQALFGFQLIAVFSTAFGEKLSRGEQHLHLAAVTMTALAVALIMTPAAFHRQRGPHHVTDAFIKVSTRLLLWSMWPLSSAICLDFYLVGRVISGEPWATAAAAALFAVYIVLWFLLPRMRFLQRLAGDRD
jgi:hypothetical protein